MFLWYPKNESFMIRVSVFRKIFITLHCSMCWKWKRFWASKGWHSSAAFFIGRKDILSIVHQTKAAKYVLQFCIKAKYKAHNFFSYIYYVCIIQYVAMYSSTGKSFSEALILESVNPQYDERLFIELQEKYEFRTCCVQKLLFCFDIQNNICTRYVLNMYFSGNSMNNL